MTTEDAITKLKEGARELREWAAKERKKNGASSDLGDGRADEEARHLEFAAWWLEHAK